MSKFRKLMAAATLLFATSSVFVACSDDDPATMGPVPVNSCQVTSTTATVIWSIVPNDRCGGYDVTLYEGTRENLGAEIAKQNFDNRTCKTTFTGLQPNSDYVVKTKAVPGEGFSDSEEFFRHFKTAPAVHVTVGAFEAYQVQEPDDDGVLVTQDRYRVTLTWPAFDRINCGGYNVILYQCAMSDWKNTVPAIVSFQTLPDNTGAIATSHVFGDLVPGKTYTVRANCIGNTTCDYGVSDYTIDEFVVPAAPAV